MSGTEETVRFDRSTAAGRRAEIAYLDSLSEADLAILDPGHRYVTQNPDETPEQRALLLQRLAEAEQRRAAFDAKHS